MFPKYILPFSTKSSGILRSNLPLKHSTYFYTIHFFLVLKPLFLYPLLPTGFYNLACFSSLAKTYSFANFGSYFGWCELQMGMTFRIDYLTTTFILLNWRTSYCSVRAKNTTISFIWFQHFFTILALVEELTGVYWHIFYFFMPAVWTRNF
jgi:hypothetical protein